MNLNIKEFGPWLKLRLRSPLRPLIRVLMFYIYDTTVIIGDSGKLHVGERCGLANTIFNLSSGSIFIGDNTIFSHNVMVITGRHQFKGGQRASLAPGVQRKGIGGGPEEVPPSGYDIHIGSGTWIAAGAIISGGVTIGDNVLIGANSVVTKDIPSYSFAAGIPAKVLGSTKDM